MKKLSLLVSLVVMMSLSSGCTYLNHQRVKQNIVRERIIASGNQEMLKMVVSGVKPTKAVEFCRPPDGSVGVMATVNILDLEGLGSYFTTYGAAPGSSTAALVADLATAYGVSTLFDTGGSDKNDVPTTAISVTINGTHNNTAINTGSGTAGNTSTDTTTATTGEGSPTSNSGSNTDKDEEPAE